MKSSILAGIAGIAFAVSGAGAASAETSPAVASAVADSGRPATDTARDGDRKPGEIVSFAGIKQGDIVAEIAPGGGYYTRILAKTVGPKGHVYAMMPSFFASRPGGLDAINKLAEEYGNVTVVVADFADFTLEKPVDLVWTTENYHDMANGNIAGINASVFKALKPGGIYFVEDHSAPGTGMSATSTIHRIDPAAVKEQVAAAGFKLEAESDLLVNPADPGDISPRDVKSGVSTKFALRFKKPG
ncbi:class I SAM-dependent methyltransferase [Altererythrobacter fulvus]|uniref:class I SAM-dependent methyltransferase n=1 Tax=Caenibius fulvus TaxID=2126012 RepID=UPI00301646AA